MTKAYVLMSAEPSSEKEIISNLKQVENVSDVHGTLGLYDVIAKVQAPTEEMLNKTITEKIRKIPRIKSTITLIRAEEQDLFKPTADHLMTAILGVGPTKSPAPKSDNLMSAILGDKFAEAYVVIHSDQGKEFNVLRNLMHIPQVKEADVVFGFYDVIAKVEASNEKELEKLITKSIRNLKNVKTTMTLNVVHMQEK